jgi:drug/metabolite transporter (DMT)-like permease
MIYGIGLALTAAALWSLAYSIDGLVLQDVPAVGLFVVDAITTALVVIPIACLRRNDVVETLRVGPFYLALIVLSVLVSAVASYCILGAIKRAGAPLASAIEIAYPVFVVILAFIRFGNVPRPLTIFGIILVVCGSALVVFSTAESDKSDGKVHESTDVIHAASTAGALRFSGRELKQVQKGI